MHCFYLLYEFILQHVFRLFAYWYAKPEDLIFSFISRYIFNIPSFKNYIVCNFKLINCKIIKILCIVYVRHIFLIICRFVEDIDLWPGILMEIPNDGAVVGPTAACIIGLQFNHLKYGDRFYFEHGYQKGSFTYRKSFFACIWVLKNQF